MIKETGPADMQNGDRRTARVSARGIETLGVLVSASREIEVPVDAGLIAADELLAATRAWAHGHGTRGLIVDAGRALDVGLLGAEERHVGGDVDDGLTAASCGRKV